MKGLKQHASRCLPEVIEAALLLFTRPRQIPLQWLKDKYRLAQLLSFTEATRQSLRNALSPTVNGRCSKNTSLASGCRRLSCGG